MVLFCVVGLFGFGSVVVLGLMVGFWVGWGWLLAGCVLCWGLLGCVWFGGFVSCIVVIYYY